jgi:hypothetical protein
MPTTVQWTRRSRLLAALSCKIADRVPVNNYELTGFNKSDWYNSQPSYAGLMDYIRKHADCVADWNPPSVTAHGAPCVPFMGSAYPLELMP